MSEASSPCPDAETVAAFLEGSLDETAAKRVAAHITHCDVCLVELRDAAEFVREPSPEPAVRGGWMRWGAVAAALVLVAGAASFYWRDAIDQFRYRRTIKPLLVASQDGERFVEARLAGGFRWTEFHDPFRGRTESTDANVARLRLKIMATEVLEKNAGSGTVSQHAAGVSTLLLGRAEQAARVLAAAATRSRRDTAIWNDLAAARYQSALRSNSRTELSGALAAVDEALRCDGDMPEALFNRALILEKLSSHDESARAWSRYLAVDSSSPWASEARAHLSGGSR